jgi:hypothetical protein
MGSLDTLLDGFEIWFGSLNCYGERLPHAHHQP